MNRIVEKKMYLINKRNLIGRYFVLSSIVLLASCSGQGGGKGLSKQELAELLKENPEILIEALSKKKVELFEVAQAGAIEKRRLQEEEKRDSEQNNPLKPVIEEGRLVRGNKNAPVTIVEYSDFECPYCSKSFITVSSLMKKYGDKIRFIYKHNPLPMHPAAMPAAAYFEAIGLQNEKEAWKFHDLLFADQKLLKKGEKGLKRLVGSLDVDMKRFENDLSNPKVKKLINDDMAEAKKFGFGGTPSFVINGMSIKGAYPENEFIRIIEIALKQRQ